MNCHPVSNDVAHVKANWAIPLPVAFLVFEKRHFALAAKVLRFRPRLMFSQSRGGPKVSPYISSVRAPTLAASNSPLSGEAGCQLMRPVSVVRPQNDSGSPAPRPCTVARTSRPRATDDAT